MKRVFLSSTSINNVDEHGKNIAERLTQVLKGLSVKLSQADQYHALIEIADEANPIDCAQLQQFIYNKLGLNLEGIDISVYDFKPEVNLGFNFMKKSGSAFDQQVLKINELKYALLNNVVGQNHAIDVVVNGLIKAYSVSNENSKRPFASFIFAGASNTGKTTIAAITSQVLELPTVMFSKQDYLKPDQIMGTLGILVTTSKKCIVIFNDFEDMSFELFSSLCFINAAGEIGPYTFKNMILFFITRGGKDIYQRPNSFDFALLNTDEVIAALGEERDESGSPIFSEYLLKRLDVNGAVMFNNLTPVHRQILVARKVEEYCKNLLEKTAITITTNVFEVARFVLFAHPEERDVKKLGEFAEKLIEDQVNFLIKQEDPENGQLLLGTTRQVVVQFDLDNASKQVKNLFANNRHTALIVAKNEDIELLKGLNIKNLDLKLTSDIEEAKKIIDDGAEFILLDPTLTQSEEALMVLDIEDYDSDGMKLFHHITRYRNNVPLYLYVNIENSRPISSYNSLLSMGARGFAILNKQELDQFQSFVSSLVYNAELGDDLESLVDERLRLEANPAQSVVKGEEGTYLLVRYTHLSLNPVELTSKNIKEEELRHIKKLDDVVGLDVAKKILLEASEYLSNTQGFIANGATPQKMILLHGDVACGKTSLIKAIARHAKADWMRFDCKEALIESDEHNVFKALRSLFVRARKAAPTLLHLENLMYLFNVQFGFSGEKLIDILNEELTICQKDSLHPVLVIAELTTDLAEYVHPELMRLVSRTVHCEYHKTEEIELFLQKLFERKNITTITKKGLHNFAQRCMADDYREIQNVVNFALAQAKGKPLTDEILADSYDLYGQGDTEINRPSTEEEKLATSYHEMGHYLLYRLFGKHPSFVTVIPRGDYGGYTMPGPDALYGPRSIVDFKNQICMGLGGRAAEVILGGDNVGINTGIGSDIKKATAYAMMMITNFAMGEDLSFYNPVEIYQTESNVKLHKDVDAILKEQYARALRLLELNRANLDLLSRRLYEVGFIMGEDAEELLPDDKLIRE